MPERKRRKKGEETVGGWDNRTKIFKISTVKNGKRETWN